VNTLRILIGLAICCPVAAGAQTSSPPVAVGAAAGIKLLKEFTPELKHLVTVH
jgi:hypothetical protein